MLAMMLLRRLGCGVISMLGHASDDTAESC
jgi:hypothetical protein